MSRRPAQMNENVRPLGSASPNELSSRPKRTRISCYAAPDRTACAAFFKESCMQHANATELDRKSGERSGEIICVDAPSWKCFRQSEA
jgi:hypothetical protein